MAALLAAPADGQASARDGALGVCPGVIGRLDSYMQALCEGEAEMKAGRLVAAIERFRFAAALPRIDASNELAWAGLAVAHCRRRDFESGRQWAAHFDQAYRLWIGELDCEAGTGDPRGAFSAFVRSRMCGTALTADYAIVRADPPTPHAVGLRVQMQQLAGAVQGACAEPAAARKGGADASARKAAKPPAEAKKRKRPASSAAAARKPAR